MLALRPVILLALGLALVMSTEAKRAGRHDISSNDDFKIKVEHMLTKDIKKAYEFGKEFHEDFKRGRKYNSPTNNQFLGKHENNEEVNNQISHSIKKALNYGKQTLKKAEGKLKDEEHFKKAYQMGMESIKKAENRGNRNFKKAYNIGMKSLRRAEENKNFKKAHFKITPGLSFGHFTDIGALQLGKSTLNRVKKSSQGGGGSCRARHDSCIPVFKKCCGDLECRFFNCCKKNVIGKKLQC